MSNLDITGRTEVLRNLEKAIGEIEGRCEKGLVRAGLELMGAAVKKTPVDTGNLRASAYVVSNSAINHAPPPSFKNTRGDAAKQNANHAHALSAAKARVAGEKPIVEVGFSTTYAAPVHEHVHIPHNVGQAKYLEDAVKSSVNKILRIIEKEAWE